MINTHAKFFPIFTKYHERRERQRGDRERERESQRREFDQFERKNKGRPIGPAHNMWKVEKEAESMTLTARRLSQTTSVGPTFFVSLTPPRFMCPYPRPSLLPRTHTLSLLFYFILFLFLICIYPSEYSLKFYPIDKAYYLIKQIRFIIIFNFKVMSYLRSKSNTKLSLDN